MKTKYFTKISLIILTLVLFSFNKKGGDLKLIEVNTANKTSGKIWTDYGGNLIKTFKIDNNYYTFYRDKAGRKGKIIVKKYDLEFKLLEKSILKSDKLEFFLDVFKMDNKLIVAVKERNGVKNNQISFKKYDLTSLKLQKTKQQSFTYPIKKDLRANFNNVSVLNNKILTLRPSLQYRGVEYGYPFSTIEIGALRMKPMIKTVNFLASRVIFSVSENGKFLGVIKNGNKTSDCEIEIYNSDLQLIWKKKEKLEGKTLNFYQEQIVISNDGTAQLLGYYQKDKKQFLKLISVSNKETYIQDNIISKDFFKNDRVLITGVKLFYDKNQNLIISGLLNNTKKYGFNYIFVSTVNSSNKTVESFISKKISDSKKNLEYEITNIQLDYDENVIINLEKNEGIVYDVNGPNYTGFSREIIVLKVNKEASIVWKKEVLKNQKSRDVYELGHGFILDKNNNLIFLFSGNMKNIANSGKRLKSKLDGSLMEVKITPDGKMTKKAIIKSRKFENETFYPKRIQYLDNKILVHSQYGKYLIIG